MSKRICWIFNHTTLRKWEIPMLVEWGYEVYTPKKYGVDFGDLSTSVTYEYDKTLTIPKSVIDYLNDIDFYSELDSKTIEYLNLYFDMIFCIVGREPLRSLLLHYYSGPIIVQCFGMMGSFSFANGMGEVYGHEMLTLIERAGSRFWFAAAYDNIEEIEPDVIKRRTIYMPISFPKKNVDEWVGGDERILFVAPKIRTSVYYKEIYEEFNENLGDLPHVIGGAQLIHVENDETVANFLPYEEYKNNMTRLAAMFYHSQEPRHIHYHPLEAVQRGMPLVFMAGGMLDNLGGKKLPGRCKSYKEARKKLLKLSRGNKRFISAITKSQKILLDKVSNDYCREIWREKLAEIQNNTIITAKPKKRLAVLLPYIESVVVRYCIVEIVNGINKYFNSNGMNVEIVFGYSRKYDAQFDLIKADNVSVRVFDERIRNGEWVDNVFSISGYTPKHIPLYRNEGVIEFYDGMRDFGDCDYVLVAAECIENHYFYSKVPYGVLVFSFIERYFPYCSSRDINIKYSNIHSSDKVITFSDSVTVDVEQIGVKKNKIINATQDIWFKSFEKEDVTRYGTCIILQEYDEEIINTVLEFSEKYNEEEIGICFLVAKENVNSIKMTVSKLISDRKSRENIISKVFFECIDEMVKENSKYKYIVIPKQGRDVAILVNLLCKNDFNVIVHDSPEIEIIDGEGVIKLKNDETLDDILHNLRKNSDCFEFYNNVEKKDDKKTQEIEKMLNSLFIF